MKNDKPKAKKVTDEVMKNAPLNVSAATIDVVFNLSTIVLHHIRQGRAWKHI